ncbi:MAG: diaminopimelate epimerase [Armatimonadetes bacterium]|nr:diaminopimelate epimerase [Armatimonadota bacterium]
MGNDFVLAGESDLPAAPLEDLARRLCDRRFGVGGDGLLVLGRSEAADFRMRMFNPDGTEDHCGNGMRCAVVAFVGGIEPGQERRVTLETRAGVKRAQVFWEGDRLLVETEMGEPRFAARDLPMRLDAERVVDYPIEVEGETIRATVVSTGTTHAVLFADRAEVERRFERVSPALEVHPLFPERTSVMWATVESPERVRLRIWERGVGETLGCGTGACATMVAARLHGYVGNRAVIASRGGELRAHWPGSGSCILTGEAQIVFRGRFPL